MHTCEWLKFTRDVKSCVLSRCASQIIPSYSMFHKTPLGVPDTSSFCSSPPPTTPTTRPLIGIRRTPCAASLEGRQPGYLAETLPHKGYEPNTCIDVSSEHTPIKNPRGETASTSRMALPPQSQPLIPLTVFMSIRQPAVVPASEVNPWLSAFLWSRTRKPVRGDVSNVSVEETFSRGKRDRDQESVQTVSERRNLHVYLEQKAELAVKKLGSEEF